MPSAGAPWTWPRRSGWTARARRSTPPRLRHDARERGPEPVGPARRRTRAGTRGRIGRLLPTVYATAGCSAPVANARRVGREIADALREQGVDAAIVTSTEGPARAAVQRWPRRSSARASRRCRSAR